MPDNLVKVVFEADTSQLKQAFASVNGEVSNVSAMAAWRKETGLSEQATIGATTGLTNFRTAIGKTAADFKPATEEMRKASVATEETGRNVEGLGIKITFLYMGYRLLREAMQAVKYALTESAQFEETAVRFKNLAGNTEAATKAFDGLSAVAKETAINVVELSAGATEMLEAGVKMKDIPDVMRSIGKEANITGHAVSEFTDIYLRAATRGEVSGRQLAMISEITGDQTHKLADEYQDMTITLPLLATQAERLAKAAERTRADTERTLSAHNAFIDKTGAGAPLFDAFQKAGGLGGSTMVPYVKVPGMENVQGQGQAQVREVWKELQTGMKQIAKEEHISSQQVSENVRVGAGGFGKEDLMSAAQRSREATEIAKQRQREDYQTAITVRKEQEKLDLAAKVEAGILPPTTGTAKVEQLQQFTNESRIAAFKLREVSNEVRDVAQSTGGALSYLGEKIKDLYGAATGQHHDLGNFGTSSDTRSSAIKDADKITGVLLQILEVFTGT